MVFACGRAELIAAEPKAGNSQQGNRLAGETSPYLLQHAHNPVDWYPWGAAAFEKARREDKPIFLSVGYSTCYWCHVMERESFEHDDVAKVLNEHFVCIKVDREERPDVDERFMLVTQLVNGRGGWPNSVWLTPEGKPWMSGTYFPCADFIDLLHELARMWREQRAAVDAQAERLSAAVDRISRGDSLQPAVLVSPALVEQAIGDLRQSYDEQHGGFRRAPKFPPHDDLRLLAFEYRRTADASLKTMFVGTLDAIADGGIRDHLGGGIHRYCVDQRWLLPHFEKMLYDNAQLLRNYALGFQITRDERYRAAADELVEWLLREMTDEQGGFYSALDSESEGHEGRYYVWSYDELMAVLGEEDATWLASVYGAERDGNFADEATGEKPGTNVLHLPRPLRELAAEQQAPAEQLQQRLEPLRKKLLEARGKRAPPHRDDKVLASWNGLMIGALAFAGQHLEQPRYVAVAERAAHFIEREMTPTDIGLMHTWRRGEARVPGYLDDYAFLADGLLDLHAATRDAAWLSEARSLADAMIERFADRDGSGFYYNTAAHDDVLPRSKNLYGGGNIPLGGAVAAQVLLRLERATGQPRYGQLARDALEATSGLMMTSEGGADGLVLAAAMSLELPPSSLAAEAQPEEEPPDAALPGDPVSAKLYTSHRRARAGQTIHVAVLLEIAEGWRLYGPNPEADFLVPSTVALRLNAAADAGATMLPAGQRKHDAVLQQELLSYSGQAWFVLPITLAADAQAGPLTLQLELTTQACDERRCLPPRTELVELEVVVDPAAGDETRHEGLLRRLGVDLPSAE